MANTKTTKSAITVFFPFLVFRNAFSVAKKVKTKLVAEQFYTCREVFHDDFPYYNNILISTKSCKYEKLKNVFLFIENKLCLESLSNIYYTQRKNVYYVKLSKFWQNKMRFNLLTLLLRSGMKKTNIITIESFCRSNQYLKETEPALNLFFSGRTKYKGKAKTWYSQFKNMSHEECYKFLFAN